MSAPLYLPQPPRPSGGWHRGASRVAHTTAQVLAGVGVAGLLLLALATTLDVTLRFVFAQPIRGFADVVALAGAVLLAACMPQVVASRGNVSIDLVGQRLGGSATRWLNRFGALLTLGFFALMAWQYARFALDLRATGETMAVLRWPIWPWWAMVALLIGITALVALGTLLDESGDGEGA